MPVTFQLSYRPHHLDPDEPDWDLIVYLDGRPLTSVPPTSAFKAKELEFSRRLAPGAHTLRVAQEQHRQERHGRWSHAARVAPDPIAFTLAPDPTGATVELSFNQGWFLLTTPLQFRVRQGERTTGDDEAFGGDPERWPLLCEEIEASLEPGESPGRAVRRQLKDCVRWGDLWGDGGAPDRAEVRAALAAADYHPLPEGP